MEWVGGREEGSEWVGGREEWVGEMEEWVGDRKGGRSDVGRRDRFEQM